MAAGARTRPVWAVWLWVRAANPAARGRGGTKKSEAEIIDCVCVGRAPARAEDGKWGDRGFGRPLGQDRGCQLLIGERAWITGLLGWARATR